MSGPEEKEGVEPPSSSTLIGQTEASRNEQEGESSVSMRSDCSKGIPIRFKEHESENEQETPGNLSMRSDRSKGIPILFKEHEDGQKGGSILSMKSDSSKGGGSVPEAHKSMSEVVSHQHELESVFMEIGNVVKNLTKSSVELKELMVDAVVIGSNWAVFHGSLVESVIQSCGHTVCGHWQCDVLSS
ncbi:uncharacterized protein V6R79_017376 [Siganus canaliculatus]